MYLKIDYHAIIDKEIALELIELNMKKLLFSKKLKHYKHVPFEIIAALCYQPEYRNLNY